MDAPIECQSCALFGEPAYSLNGGCVDDVCGCFTCERVRVEREDAVTCGDWAPINASEQECTGCGVVRPIPADCTSEPHDCSGDHVYHFAAPQVAS